jgi:aryl-alcohol dehydrogenase-like predicted oxidoreductase
MQLLRFAHAPETIRVGGNDVRRLGFATSALPVADRAAAHAVLKRAIELGVELFDVARDPMRVELVREALSPYPGDVVFMTTAGAVRDDRGWHPALHADELRAAVEDDLRLLQLDQLHIVQLRWCEQDELEFTTALDALLELRHAGKLRDIALGNVDVGLLDEALAKTPVVAVQAVLDPDLLAVCEKRAIAYIPVSQLAPRTSTSQSSTVDRAAARLGCTPAQLVIASLLAKSPVLVPAPAADTVVHLEENLGAVHVTIDEQTVNEIAKAA